MPDLRLLPAGPVFLAESAEGTRSFVASLWFSTGSRHEAPQKRGFAHFIEHMLFKGTGTRDAAMLAREFDRTGGYVNAFTEKDCVCLHCIVPVSAWTVAVDLLSDMAFGSIFPTDEIEREKDVVVSEILQIDDDPEEKSHDEFLARIWPGDPAARPIAGSVDEVRAIRRADIIGWYRRCFAPREALIAVSSPLSSDLVAARFGDAIDRALTDASSMAGHAGTATSGDLSEVLVATTPQFSACRSVLAADAAQIYYYQAVQLDPPFQEADFYSLTALNSITGDSSGSRLFQELREKRGLCYTVGSGFADSRSECLWLAQAVTQSRNFPAMTKDFDRVLYQLGQDGPTGIECSEAVSRLLGSYELALDDPEFRMRRLARQYMITGEVLSAEETGRRYASISERSIRELAVRLFRDVPRARFAYGRIGVRAERAMQGEDRANP